MYDELSASNATGSFQNQCSVASQMDPTPDEPSSSGTRAKRPIRKRDMTALLAEVALLSPMKSRCQLKRKQNQGALLIQGVIDVIKKQMYMDDYLGGELATLCHPKLSIKICSSAQHVCRANTCFG